MAGRQDLAREYVSSAFFLLLGIAFVLAIGYRRSIRVPAVGEDICSFSPAVIAELPWAVTCLYGMPFVSILWYSRSHSDGVSGSISNALWAPFSSLLALLLVIVAITKIYGFWD